MNIVEVKEMPVEQIVHLDGFISLERVSMESYNHFDNTYTKLPDKWQVTFATNKIEKDGCYECFGVKTPLSRFSFYKEIINKQ